METFIGFISPFPYTFAPSQWAMCQGQLLPIEQNTALFSLLGTYFGGDGRTVFALPDLRGRQIIGLGTSHTSGTTYEFAQTGGMETVTLTPTQAPLAAHTHTATFTPSGGGEVQVKASTDPLASSTTPETGSYIAGQRSVGGTSLFVPGSPAPTSTVALGGISGGSAGGEVTVNPNNPVSAASPVGLMNPFLALNFCIALSGIYPSRP